MIDRDGAFNPSGDEFVDAFLIDISQSMIAAGSGMTEVMALTGIFEIANTTLSFEVECLPGFVGESCVPVCSTDPCSNNGTCLQSVSGFTCVCRGNFTGETCETRINDCQDVDCNDGTCMDGVACQCDPGFTGEFCERRITTAGMTINDVTTGSNSGTMGNSNSSSNVGAVAGAVVGSIVGLVIAAAIVAIILIMCIWKRKSSPTTMQGIP